MSETEYEHVISPHLWHSHHSKCLGMRNTIRRQADNQLKKEGFSQCCILTSGAIGSGHHKVSNGIRIRRERHDGHRRQDKQQQTGASHCARLRDERGASSGVVMLVEKLNASCNVRCVESGRKEKCSVQLSAPSAFVFLAGIQVPCPLAIESDSL